LEDKSVSGTGAWTEEGPAVAEVDAVVDPASRSCHIFRFSACSCMTKSLSWASSSSMGKQQKRTKHWLAVQGSVQDPLLFCPQTKSIQLNKPTGLQNNKEKMQNYTSLPLQHPANNARM